MPGGPCNSSPSTRPRCWSRSRRCCTGSSNSDRRHRRVCTSSLTTILIAGSALSPELSNRIQDTFGDVLYNMYGSTECAIATVATPAELRAAPGTAGRAPVTCEVVLYDEHDQRVNGANRRGRIFVRNGAPFSGYTDGRNKQIVDGYMSSGDMGHFDENGLLFVDGRDDDMIVSGGENVFPQEVENLLEKRADVAEIAVVGVDDVEFGKRLRAFVVSEPGAVQDPAEIKQFVKENLAGTKCPAMWCSSTSYLAMPGARCSTRLDRDGRGRLT